MSNFMKGLQVAGIGLVIVFSVLIILITVITILTKVLHAFTEKKPKAAPAAKPAPESAAVPAPAPAAAAEPEGLDPEVVAVISAAVAAFRQNGDFVVRRVRRVPAWKNAALNDTVTRF